MQTALPLFLILTVLAGMAMPGAGAKVVVPAHGRNR